MPLHYDLIMTCGIPDETIWSHEFTQKIHSKSNETTWSTNSLNIQWNHLTNEFTQNPVKPLDQQKTQFLVAMGLDHSIVHRDAAT